VSEREIGEREKDKEFKVIDDFLSFTIFTDHPVFV